MGLTVVKSDTLIPSATVVGDTCPSSTILSKAKIIPIIGTQNLERITDSAKAAEINLSARDFYDIVEAYRGEAMP